MASRVLITAGALALSACAPVSWQDDWQDAGKLPGDARCEDATAEGIGQQTAEAREFARAGVKHQLADVRGNLLAQGLRRIRVVAREVHCQPHSLGLGLIRCSALLRLCGR